MRTDFDMGTFDAFRYDGKRVIVVGGATGMGRATAELLLDAGADVTVLDYANVDLAGAKAIQVNLADKDSIDKAFEEVTGDVHAVFAAAGVADGTPGIERINFIGHRYYIDKLRKNGQLPRGSAIGFISSAAGMAWELHLSTVKEFLAIEDWDAASKWCVDNNSAHYLFTKMAVCAYVSYSCMDWLKDGIRINAICPGPTDTPLAQANKETWLGFAQDYRDAVGVEASTPLEQAYPLVFLCSDAAKAITGQVLVSDEGYFSAGITDAFEPGAMIAKLLMGRIDPATLGG
ncbi:MAG TPA: SDR family oxidoreductase [Mycobacteriales bacterium]|nr:SDR family oxidoreductase [Mycobacteriales bacterium]